MSLKRARSRSRTSADRRRTRSPRRIATLYDAVAGRIGYESFISDARPSATRDTTSISHQPVPPEEVLFRRKGAPPRYEETDKYFASDRLNPATHPLPDSDLLKAIHSYASDFYAAGPLKGKWSWGSMDETALLALGILIEESVKDSIGSTGDLAFLEGEDEDGTVKGKGLWDGRTWRRSVIRKDGTGPKPQGKTGERFDQREDEELEQAELG